MTKEELIIYCQGHIDYFTCLREETTAIHLHSYCDGSIKAYSKIMEILKNEDYKDD